MFKTKLELRADNDEPKCKNCVAWEPKPVATYEDKPIYGTIGQCTKNTPYQAAPTWFTTDLQVCSAWEPK